MRPISSYYSQLAASPPVCRHQPIGRHCLKLAAIILLASPGSAFAQVMLSPAFEDEAKPAEAEPKVFTLHPAAEPDPALRYRFWPAIDQRRNVSPHPFLARATLLATQAMAQDRDNEFVQSYDRIHELPLDQVPSDEVREFLDRYATSALNQLEEIDSLMDTTYDMQLEDRSLNEIVEWIIPEVQESRQLARLLQVRARLAIAEQRWDDAVNDIRIGFRLSEIVGDSAPLIVNKLVGLAIAGVNLSVVEEAIQQPGCPNLYWALAAVPSQRLYPIRDALEWEGGNIARLLRDSNEHPERVPNADDARSKLVTLANTLHGFFQLSGQEATADDAAVRLMTGAYVVMMAEPSRELLAASSDWSQRVEDLTPPQAVYVATRLQLQRTRDVWTKWTLLPPNMEIEFEEKMEESFEELGNFDVASVSAKLLLPAARAAGMATRRLTQQHHFLMTLEAIRMHADQAGELPESLEDLQPVPALPDAVAEQPFGYERASATTATLTRAPRWQGDQETEVSIQLVETENQ